MYIIFSGENIINIDEKEKEDLLTLKYIYIDEKGNIYLNKECKELNYLFSNNTPIFKRKMYLREINKVRFTCSMCGAKYSFHVSPKIDENGNVDFKQIVCVCRNCRTKKLVKRNILQPQFKLKIDWDYEIKKICHEISQKELISPRLYRKYRIQQILIEKYLKVVLPPLREPKYVHPNLLKFKQELIEMGDIDLNSYENRNKVRRYLYQDMKGFCPCCGKKLIREKMTIDHIVAKSLGGKNNIDNFIGLCQKCNEEKGGMTIFEFLSCTELRYMPYNILFEAHKQQEYWKIHINDIINEINKLNKNNLNTH